MLERVFIGILNMSLTGSVVICAVLIARLLLKKAPRAFSCVLWAAVFFRLLCPVTFTADFSLLGVLKNESSSRGQMEYIPPDIAYQNNPQVTLPLPALENAVNDALPAAAPPASVNPLQIWLSIGSRLWALGVLAILTGSAVSSLRLFRHLRHGRCIRDNIYRIPGGGTPFVCGLIRPRIYFPEGSHADDSDYIILHEQAHIRRGDHIFRLIAWLALILHWFNPLVWLAFHASGRDMEMSCDEAVLRKAGSGIKKDYSASLLALSAGKQEIRGVPLAFGEKEPESRIKNVLRYKKPAAAVLVLAAAVCAASAFFLLGNPKPAENAAGGSASAEGNSPGGIAPGKSAPAEGNSPGESAPGESASAESSSGEVFYGAVTARDARLVFVPGPGEIEIPPAKTVGSRIEMDFQGLEAGQILRITFPADEEVMILETYPGRFSAPAESIEVMGAGFDIRALDDGNCLFTMPPGLALGAAKGDTLRVFHSVIDGGNLLELYPRYMLESPDKIRTELLAETTVSGIGPDGGIQVELSPRQAQTFLSEFGFGVSCQTVQADAAGAIRLNGGVPDGTYLVHPRSISRSLRGFDRFAESGMPDEDPEAPEGDKTTAALVFADDCAFFINREMDKVRYEETGFDEFADLIDDAFSRIDPPVRCVFKDGLITEAFLQSACYGAGITYEPLTGYDDWYAHMGELEEGKSSEEMLAEYYTLARTEEEISTPPVSRIEIYTGNIGDGGSGIVLLRDEGGNLLYTVSAHCARAGWNNIYLGRLDGSDYLMTVHIENRDGYGEYGYQVFWPDENGELRQIAGSSFRFGADPRDGYDDSLFAEWAGRLEDYLSHSHLLLSTQEGEIRTDPVSEADKYNYETLKP